MINAFHEWSILNFMRQVEAKVKSIIRPNRRAYDAWQWSRSQLVLQILFLKYLQVDSINEIAHQSY